VRVVAVLSLGQSFQQVMYNCMQCVVIGHILVGGRVDKGNERGGSACICVGPSVLTERVIYTFGTAWSVLYSDWERKGTGREGRDDWLITLQKCDRSGLTCFDSAWNDQIPCE